MIVRILGSAAGGGVPQWNCSCPNCAAARRGERPCRSQSSFAISADGKRWWLVNVSPDVAAQIEAFAPLQPNETRGTPIAGFLITDANVDHLGGLAVLRQDGDHHFELYSSATVRAVAKTQPAFAPFAGAPHHWHTVASDESFVLDERLHVRVVAVPGLTPGYDGRRAVIDAVVAYEIGDAGGTSSVLFAPVFAAFEAPLREAVSRCDLALLDGSFWSDDELSELGVAKAAQSLGHLPVGGPDGSLAALGPLPQATRVGYVHVNNSSPLLDPDSHAARAARDAGTFVTEDGMEFAL
jgi:pyrroloquinoline quinone biosynthesis protein B